jgi:predicted ATPase/DNA-binding SARP family transcriptional activator/Tfp pilus assembly protein PilF
VNEEVVLEASHPKPLALLAYLAVEAHRSHRRRELSALFWPDQPEKQALQNLRKTLSRLRRAINDHAAEPSHLLIEQQTIQFNADSDAWLDVGTFTEEVSWQQGHRHRRLDACPICLSKLAAAVEHYRGRFLDGVRPSGSESFREWLTVRRAQLEQQACVAFHALAKSQLAQDRPEVVCRYARRLLHIDPWNEAGQRLLLQAVTLNAGRNAALRQYELFRQELEEELGVAPEDETLALVDQIRTGAFPVAQRPSPLSRMPAPATSFVGREVERQQVASYLAGYDQRLLTISGPGGSGKSRLALEIVNEQLPYWLDGVWFIPLADVPGTEGLTSTLAAALGYKPKDTLETSGLIDYLKPKEALLVLDGYEHLAADTSLIREILRWAPQVSMLITSRARLGIHREWVVPLKGLKIPPHNQGSLRQVQNASAVTLFIQNARRAVPAFELTEENLPDVLRICRHVEGLPLGIELASAWVRMFPPKTIAEEMERSLDFLGSPHKKNPGRLQSLRASFNYSYDLLSPTERSLFRQLSVFRDGFTVAACRTITGKEPDHLVSLLDKSLIESPTRGRLDLHLTLREYASEQLAKHPREGTETRVQHGAYYLAFLQAREDSLRSKEQEESLEEISQDIGNISAAWNWAIDGARLSEIEASTQALTLFYAHSSRHREGELVFSTAADRLLSSGRNDLETFRVASQLRLEQAYLLLHRRQARPLGQAAEDAIDLAQRGHDAISEAYGTFYRGAALWLQADLEPARSQLERARTLAQRARDKASPEKTPRIATVEGRCLNLLAGICWKMGRLNKARRYLEEMLPLFTGMGDQSSKAAALGNLGLIASERGDYIQAKGRYEQGLRIHQEVGNPVGQSAAHVNLGELYLAQGALVKAEAHLKQALDIVRQIHSKSREAMVLSDLSQLAHYRGEDEIAREYSYKAIRLAEEDGDHDRLGMAWMILGYALLGMGQLGESAEAFRRSVNIRAGLEQPNLTAEALAGLAQVALSQEDLNQAMSIIEEILEQLSTGSLVGTADPFQIRLTCYNVLREAHDERAGDFLDSAYRKLQKQAAHIDDAMLRRSFLENVPSHRTLVSLFQQTAPGAGEPAHN